MIAVSAAGLGAGIDALDVEPRREGLAIEYPYFDLMGHQVWGATAMILGEFICLI